MAWTTPKTFAAAVLTAAELNTHLRDNLNILKTSISDSGRTKWPLISELTISSGAITATGNAHTVDTEADAATDELDTITAGANVDSGHLLVLRQASGVRHVTLKHGTGNLLLPHSRDLVLGSLYSGVTLLYGGANWVVADYAPRRIYTVQSYGNITAGAATAYYPINSAGIPLNPTESLVQQTMKHGGFISGLSLRTHVAAGGGKVLAVTLMKSGAAQTLTASITDAAGEDIDTTHEVEFDAGDSIYWRVTLTAGGTTGTFLAMAQIEAKDDDS